MSKALCTIPVISFSEKVADRAKVSVAFIWCCVVFYVLKVDLSVDVVGWLKSFFEPIVNIFCSQFLSRILASVSYKSPSLFSLILSKLNTNVLFHFTVTGVLVFITFVRLQQSILFMFSMFRHYVTFPSNYMHAHCAHVLPTFRFWIRSIY